MISSKIRILFNTFIKHYILEILAKVIKQEKKDTQTRKGEVKSSLFTNNVILHIEILRNSLKNLKLLSYNITINKL